MELLKAAGEMLLKNQLCFNFFHPFLMVQEMRCSGIFSLTHKCISVSNGHDFSLSMAGEVEVLMYFFFLLYAPTVIGSRAKR